MIRDSLRLRLLTAAAVATACALALAWIAMTVIFDRHVERRVVDELGYQALPLLAGLAIDPSGIPSIADEPSDPRFATPTSGLYWQATTEKGRVRSRSLWDSQLALPSFAPSDRWGERRAAGPFGQDLLLLERRVRPDSNGPIVIVQLGYDLTRLAPARQEFGREMALFLTVLWAALAFAAWIQVSLGLKPLRRVEAEMERLRRDPAARLVGTYPRELKPLVHAVDALADAREADVTRARRRAADLAHGLKTPLSALAAQSRRAREAGAVVAADGLDRAVAAIRGAIEGELARTRIGLAQSTGRHSAALPLIERLVHVIEQSEWGETILFTIDVSDAVMLPLAGDDAAELLGPLLDNAARHARRQVLVSGVQGPEGPVLRIGDDGPGLDAARHGEAVLRGARLDSAGDGHGLGLAIARELVESTGGTLALDAASLGGLEVRLSWPS